jgi:hypothetical protein
MRYCAAHCTAGYDHTNYENLFSTVFILLRTKM